MEDILNKTRIIVLGALLAAIAALFQLMPYFFSEMLVLLTIFSGLPIYIISRINPKVGVLSYIVASAIIMFFTVHEGLFFLCTNGIIGLSLGICNYYTKRKSIIWIISSFILTLTLSIMNYGIGIPVFGGKIPGNMIIQLAILLCFSVIYNIVYYYFLNFIFKRLNKLKYF